MKIKSYIRGFLKDLEIEPGAKGLDLFLSVLAASMPVLFYLSVFLVMVLPFAILTSPISLILYILHKISDNEKTKNT